MSRISAIAKPFTAEVLRRKIEQVFAAPLAQDTATAAGLRL
jgi:hypothetical protein